MREERQRVGATAEGYCHHAGLPLKALATEKRSAGQTSIGPISCSFLQGGQSGMAQHHAGWLLSVSL